MTATTTVLAQHGTRITDEELADALAQMLDKESGDAAGALSAARHASGYGVSHTALDGPWAPSTLAGKRAIMLCHVG